MSVYNTSDRAWSLRLQALGCPPPGRRQGCAGPGVGAKQARSQAVQDRLACMPGPHPCKVEPGGGGEEAEVHTGGMKDAEP